MIYYFFILTFLLTPASESDTNYFPYCTAFSRHTKQPIQKAYADKGYPARLNPASGGFAYRNSTGGRKPNRIFLVENKIEDGIMRKDTTTAKFTRLNSEKPFNRGSVQYHEGPQNPEGDYRIEDRCAQRVK